VGPTKLVCEVLARHAGTIVARGSFEQRVVPVETFRAEVDARRIGDQRPADPEPSSLPDTPRTPAGA
jgi:hypothetical protein